MDRLDTVVAGITCRQVLHHLGDFLDGDLPVPDVARVTAHLANCRTCEQFGGRVGSLVSALRSGVVSEPSLGQSLPEEVAGRLRGRLMAERG